jgi:hypothetical protein
MDMPSKCTIVRVIVQARSHGIAGDKGRDSAQRNAQNTQKKRLYSVSVKLPIKVRKTYLRP